MGSSAISSSNLTKEKSLWSLYLLSYKFPTSRFNLWSTFAVAILLGMYSILGNPRHEELANTLREIIKLGVSLVPSILGFLIAGFTVFVTVTKSEIFAFMAVREYENTGESYLKYNLSAFMLAFAHYIAYLSTCVFLAYFGQPNGPLPVILKLVAAQVHYSPSFSVYKAMVGFSLILFGAWTWYLVMLLKSFIYNTYQVVTTTVRWTLEMPDRSK